MTVKLQAGMPRRDNPLRQGAVFRKSHEKPDLQGFIVNQL
jgi:hypothetical protein